MSQTEYRSARFLRELAERGESGAIGFAGCVLVVIGVGPNLQAWKDIVMPVCLAILLVNMTRFYLGRTFIRGRIARQIFHPLIISVILLNVALWNVFFLRAYFHDQLSGVASLLSLFLTAGFSAGATVSLAPSLRATLLFQAGIIVPLISTALYFYSKTYEPVMLAFVGSALAFTVFNLVSTIRMRRDLTKLFSQEFELIETRRRLAEEQEKLIHSSRLASLGEMAGGLAHEINNPLAILLLGIDSFDDVPPGQNASEYSGKKIATMRKAVDRIAKIVKGLRHFSQQGDSVPVEPVSVKSIIEETLEFFLGRMKKLEIKYSVECETEVRVKVRPVQISQVLLNLLSNALDAISTIESKRILIRVTSTESEVWIEVEDSGPGPSAVIKDRLFQPFTTSKPPGLGMGLGLSISKGIMKEHKGDLIFVSTAPRTTFRIILPL